MKTCRSCETEKPISDFYADSHYADKHKVDCKVCYNKKTTDWMKKNRQRVNAAKKEWGAKNPEKVAAYLKKWRTKNIEKARNDYKKWAAVNRHIVNANDRKRMARKMNALPAWADLNKIKEIYAKARSMGRGYHVDHIIPLQGKNVCGLHVETNLQILKAYDNQSKGNRMDEERLFA